MLHKISTVSYIARRLLGPQRELPYGGCITTPTDFSVDTHSQNDHG